MPSQFHRALAVTFAFSLLATIPLHAQSPGVVLKSGAAEMTIGGRVQTQWSSTTVDTVPSTAFELRRLRLEALVKINDLVSGKIQPDFAPGNRAVMKDAYMRLDFDAAFAVLAGQAFRPFSLVTMTSSTRILPIERGVRIRGVEHAWDAYNLVSELGYSERDVGLQVMGAPHGAPLGLRYQAGWFNGPARAVAHDRNTYQLAARLGIAPLPHVHLAAAWSGRDFVRTSSDSATLGAVIGTHRGNAWEADVEYGSYDGGPHLVGEATYGDFDPYAGTRFAGAQGWLAYRTHARPTAKLQAVEPVLRVSYGDANVNDRGPETGGGTLVTPGVNLYLGGLNRVMFNWDFWNPLHGQAQNGFKAQFQLGF